MTVSQPMYSIILGGGSGTRLWPLSRYHYPKQFHAFKGDGSLFQDTVRRCASALGSDEVVVLANDDYRFLVAEQLDDIGVQRRSIILEPAPRNTAPAIALAALKVHDTNPAGVMLVAPSDHMIEDQSSFSETIRKAVGAARNGRLVTLGIEPAYPATGYGYIKRGNDSPAPDGAYFPVEAFVEKPDSETASRFMEAGGYYWNSGIFLFTAESYLDELERHQPRLLEVCRKAWEGRDTQFGFESVGESFSDAESISIDYAVMEKTQSSVVVPHTGDWNDIGSWSGLTGTRERDEQGNTVSGNVVLHEVSDSLVFASNRLVAGVGLEDMVVVETKDAVLVSRRSEDQNVKQIVDMLKSTGAPETDFHTLVFRPWGAYEDLDEGQGFHVKRLIIKPGASISLQRHFHRSEHWVVVQGEANVVRDEEQFVLGRNESTYIPKEAVHKLSNEGTEDLVVVEVQTGDYLDESDIERLKDDYGRS